MGFGSWLKEKYNSLDSSLGGWLPGGGTNPFDRPGSDMADPERQNFDLPGYQGIQERYDDYLNQVGDRETPQLGPAMTATQQQAQQSGFRDQQGSLAALLMARARGEDSLAEEQARQVARQSVAQQSALARSGVGNPAAAQRLAMNNQSRIMSGLSGQSALARLAEGQAAAGQLGGLLGQGRGQDEALGMFNASQGNQLGMFNAGQMNQQDLNQANLTQNQYGINDNAINNLLGGSLQAAGMQQGGGIGYEQNQTNRYVADMGVPSPGEQLLGGAVGTVGAIAAGGGFKAGNRPDTSGGLLERRGTRPPGMQIPATQQQPMGSPSLNRMVSSYGQQRPTSPAASAMPPGAAPQTMMGPPMPQQPPQPMGGTTAFNRPRPPGPRGPRPRPRGF